VSELYISFNKIRLHAGTVLEENIGAMPPQTEWRALEAENRSSEGSSGVGYGKGCPLPSQLESMGERCELPSRIRCRATAANWIFAYFEGYRMLLYAPICWCCKSCNHNIYGRARPRFGRGNCPLPPNIEPHLPSRLKQCKPESDGHAILYYGHCAQILSTVDRLNNTII